MQITQSDKARRVTRAQADALPLLRTRPMELRIEFNTLLHAHPEAMSPALTYPKVLALWFKINGMPVSYVKKTLALLSASEQCQLRAMVEALMRAAKRDHPKGRT